MISAITHYQTSFRVVDEDGGALQRLKQNVYGWVCQKETDRCLKDGARDFFINCRWTNLKSTQSTVETRSFFSQETPGWAIRYTHADAVLGRQRFWHSDVGLCKQGADVVVSVRTSYSWNNEDLSGDRVEPNPSVPKVVRYLLQGNTVYSGRPDYRLVERPIFFDTLGMGKALATFIRSHERRYPLVVFNGDDPALRAEADALARELTGKAQVALMITDLELAREFEANLPKEYCIRHGYFRVFFPFSRRPNHPERHRFYNIESDSYAEQRAGIVHGLLRNHILTESGGIESLDDIHRLITRASLLKIRVEDPKEQAELKEFLDEHARVATERDHAKSEAETYANESDAWEKEFRKAERKAQALEVQLGRSQQSVGIDIAAAMPKLPQTLAEVAKLAAVALPRLSLTPGALKSASDYTACKSIHEAWEMLVNMNDTLHRLKFQDAERDLEGAFRNQTGYELAMTEGRMTKSDPKLMRLRDIVHDGRAFDIAPHLKHGNDEPKSIRIYFAFDEESQRIVVGHIGKHLDNYTTKKR